MILKFFSNKYRRIGLLIGLLTAGAATLFYCEQKDDEPAICINEVCGYNFSVAADEFGNYSDYIEIYNLSDEEIDKDYYLSDSKKNLKKIKIETPIEPGEYRVIWLSGETAPFNIDKHGETVYLSTDGGRVVDAVAVPLLPYDVSFSRKKDGTGDFDTFEGTPGQTNEGAKFAETELIKEPEFSIEDGFYNEGTQLKLSAGFFDTVYYTDDGSEPTENSKKYKAPIKLYDASTNDNMYANVKMYPTYRAPDYKIDKANIIKAIAVNKFTGKKSKVVSHVYFVGFDEKPQYDGVEIMSLVFDPASLFDYEKGIYTLGRKYEEYKKMGGFENLPDEVVPASFIDENGEEVNRFEYTNSSNTGREWERRATMTAFDENRDITDKKDIGVRIAGESTRFVFQKSLNLYARDIYSDEGFFTCGFNEGEKKLRLRRGDGRILFQEAFLHSVLDNMGIANSASRPCALFLNGEYWGVYTLREQYDEKYFEYNYGIDPEDLCVIKNGEAEFGDRLAKGDYRKSIDSLAYFDLSDDKQAELVESSVNVDNMIDYFCALLFFDDEDIDPDHNQILYKDKDGAWNWAAYDLDVTCGDPSFNTISYYRDKGEEMFLPGCMYEREGFKDRFRDRMSILLENELSYKNLHELLMEYDHIYRKQNIETYRRFEDPNYSEADYEKDLMKLDDFLKERGAYIKEYLEEDLVQY